MTTNQILNGYRNDDFTTYVFVSEDLGLTWNSLTQKFNENAANATISVMAMAANTNGNTSFDVLVKNSTATNGSDYTFSTTTITIPGGKDSTVVLTIPLTDDQIFEGDEKI